MGDTALLVNPITVNQLPRLLAEILGRLCLSARRTLQFAAAVILTVLLCTSTSRGEQEQIRLSQNKGAQTPAEKSTDPDDPQKPMQVTVGAYINQILEINFAEDYFVIDMWLWFRWEPAEPGQFSFATEKNYPLETFEITNGQILERSGQLTESKDADGRPFTYQNVRVVAKITQRFNMRPYPAENHALELLVEDSEERIQKVLYVADTEFSRLGTGVTGGDHQCLSDKFWQSHPQQRWLLRVGVLAVPLRHRSAEACADIDRQVPLAHLLGHYRGDTGPLPQTRVGRAVRSGHRSDLRDRGQQIHHYLEHPRRGAIRVFRCNSNPVSGDRGAHNRRIHLGRPPRGARDSL